MKLGLDLHDTIDAVPTLFRDLTEMLERDCCAAPEINDRLDHEVHIMTGAKWDNEITKFLNAQRIWFTHYFSITDYLQAKGVDIVYDEKGRPWMDQYEWNKAKGDYAREQKLDLVLDDSDVYPAFYSTPCAIFKSGKEWLGHVKKQ